ncbi:hypothetical protein SNEBB_004323, partial [Seison nebaliae]
SSTKKISSLVKTTSKNFEAIEGDITEEQTNRMVRRVMAKHKIEPKKRLSDASTA